MTFLHGDIIRRGDRPWCRQSSKEAYQAIKAPSIQAIAHQNNQARRHIKRSSHHAIKRGTRTMPQTATTNVKPSAVRVLVVSSSACMSLNILTPRATPSPPTMFTAAYSKVYLLFRVYVYTMTYSRYYLAASDAANGTVPLGAGTAMLRLFASFHLDAFILIGCVATTVATTGKLQGNGLM